MAEDIRRAIRELEMVPVADAGLLLRFGIQKSVRLNAVLHHLALGIRQAGFPEVEDVIPGYSSLLIRYAPESVASSSLQRGIAKLLSEMTDAMPLPRRLVNIPVAYGGEFGPDLDEVGRRTGMVPEELVAHHTAAPYYVYCLGFAPGFPYLGGLPPSLHCPRRDEPRQSIPAGSVGIGGQQTGIYPQAGPGGWQIIGRTPCRLFNARSQAPSALSPGDLIQFTAIDEGKYLRITDEILAGAGDGLAVRMLGERDSTERVQQVEAREAEGGT